MQCLQPGRNPSALTGVLPPYLADLLLPNLEHLLREEHISRVMRLSLKQPVWVLPRVSVPPPFVDNPATEPGHLTDDVDILDLTQVASDFLFDSMLDSGTADNAWQASRDAWMAEAQEVRQEKPKWLFYRYYLYLWQNNKKLD